MTVSYNLSVATSGPWSLVKLLLKWRGSLIKAVWIELLAWLIGFFFISAVYRFALTEEQRTSYNAFAMYLDKEIRYIPLDFMLGFFVAEVVRRFGVIFNNIGILDNVSLMASAHIKGNSDEIRMIRRNIVRYCALSQCLVFRDISLQVRKRFPTMDTVVIGGFMMAHEKERFESITNGFAKYWMPFQWAISLANHARRIGACDSDIRLDTLINEIKEFRTQMATLCNYDWVPLPIMYPQLVFLAVHVYFFLALFSRQFVTQADKLDVYFPVLSTMQFIFYIGWLKVAEALLNPMGEDDDDFECNWLLDRNLRIGLTIADEGYECTPELRKDDFWGTDKRPLYSVDSSPIHQLIGSASMLDLTARHSTVDLMKSLQRRLHMLNSKPWSTTIEHIEYPEKGAYINNAYVQSMPNFDRTLTTNGLSHENGMNNERDSNSPSGLSLPIEAVANRQNSDDPLCITVASVGDDVIHQRRHPQL